MSYLDKSDFEKQRDKLIGEIAENLARCVTNVNQLNRNIETVTAVGTGFEPVRDLWKQFETVMANAPAAAAMAAEGEARKDFLQPQFPEGTDETAVLPVGIPPGGGEVAVAGNREV